MLKNEAGIEYARPDVARAERQGAGEVIYGAGKTPAQIAGIAEALFSAGQSPVLITRLSEEASAEIQKKLPLTYYPDCRLGVLGSPCPDAGKGMILVACGGTSDLPVAEEAAVTAETLGNRVERLYDVGVAGIHRLLEQKALLLEARVIIAVAGMEGALPSVIGGLVSVPVIAVPTSVGYGASFSGLSALLGMLNSCASGVSVVNIDNGFGAGFLASRINHL